MPRSYACLGWGTRNLLMRWAGGAGLAAFLLPLPPPLLLRLPLAADAGLAAAASLGCD